MTEAQQKQLSQLLTQFLAREPVEINGVQFLAHAYSCSEEDDCTNVTVMLVAQFPRRLAS